MLPSTSKPSSPKHPVASVGACPKCAGRAVPTDEGARCVNCGWYGFCAIKNGSPDQPSTLESDSFPTFCHCELDQKHGKVSVHAHIGKAYRMLLCGHRKAFNRWGSLERSTIEDQLFGLLFSPSRAGKRRYGGLRISASRDTVDFLRTINPVRTKNFLWNTFGYPFSHGYLRDCAPRGVSENSARILFWQTARDLSGPLQCWLRNRGQAEPSYVKLHQLVLGKCGRATDDLILRYLIDLNWKNAGRDFPDKPAIENRQTLRYLKPKPYAQFSAEYVHSTGWLTDANAGERMFSAIGRSRNPLQLLDGGRVLAHAILLGHYIVRSRNFVKVSLSPNL